MKILTDENLGERYGKVLALCYKNIDPSHFLQYFDSGVKDPKWIEVISTWRPRPVIVTADKAMLNKRSIELRSMKQSGAHFVIFSESWMTTDFPGQSWRLIKLWPRIREAIEETPGQVILKVDIIRQRVTALDI